MRVARYAGANGYAVLRPSCTRSPCSPTMTTYHDIRLEYSLVNRVLWLWSTITATWRRFVFAPMYIVISYMCRKERAIVYIINDS